MNSSKAPEGLSELEYARHVLEEVLCWPARGNLEMMGDCIRSISKTKRISLVQAHSYMLRAIGLARKQGVEVNKWFFQEGMYANMRPVVLDDVYTKEAERQKASEEHGCMSGWVYPNTSKEGVSLQGVVRCQKCQGRK